MKITDRKQLLRKIELAEKRLAREVAKLQEAYDCEELLRGGDASEHRKAQNAVEKILRSVDRIKKVRLPKLGRALAEFDTAPLGGDAALAEESVTL